MSLNSVQQQVRGYIDGVLVTGWENPIDCRVLQPVNDYAKLSTPLVFVWGAAGAESRIAIPRNNAPGAAGPGWKQDDHMLGVWIFGLELASDPNRAWKFPVLIQAVRNALAYASPMPVQLTDPNTGDISTLMDLGEKMTWEYDVDRTLADQRLIRNLCRLEVAAKEVFQA